MWAKSAEAYLSCCGATWEKKDRHDARGMGCHVLMPDFCLIGPQEATEAECFLFFFLPLLKLTAAWGLCTLRWWVPSPHWRRLNETENWPWSGQMLQGWRRWFCTRWAKRTKPGKLNIWIAEHQRRAAKLIRSRRRLMPESSYSGNIQREYITA